jgi:hypothetical protein
VNFGSVPLGTTVSEVAQLKNIGSTNLTISGAQLTGVSEFKLCSLTYPITLTVGQTVNCTLRFSAASLGSVAAAAKFSTSTGSLVSVAMAATGVTASLTLSDIPSSLNFGNVTVGKSETLSVQLENTGDSSITVSGISVPMADIKASGGISGATIAPGQKATLNVTFAPTKAETVSGAVSVTSNATNSPTKIAVAGAGVPAGAYSVTLNWAVSTSSGIAGYNVYRAVLPGTTYSKLNLNLVASTSYVDSSVASGGSYSYHVTAVNSQGEESAPSSSASATIP